MKKRLHWSLVFSLVVVLVLVITVGGIVRADAAEFGTPEPASIEGETSAGDAPAPTPTGLLEDIVPTRTPAPTATPDRVERQVQDLTRRAGLAQTTLLGISVSDWVNLGISLLLVLVGYLIGTWLIRSVLHRAVQRTTTEFDDRLLLAIGSNLRWLVVLITLHFTTLRLTFVNAQVKSVLNDVYFVAGLLLTAAVIIQLIDMAGNWTRERALEEGREGQLEPLILLLTRVGWVLVVMLGVFVLLSHFGVNITGLAAMLGIGGLALSLAAQDTIADAIAGFVILVDQPFRIGDRIEIQEEHTWGDVVDIGLRTTRIRTRDNRLVIVPNSTISENQVINYSYPDPRYRIQTHVGIAYGTDIERARSLIIDTVRQIEGVLHDKPVEALYVEMGDSAMVFRVRWWIESYVDTRRMFDRVHTALQNALDEAGIECPFPTQTLNLQMNSEMAALISHSPGEQNQRSAGT